MVKADLEYNCVVCGRVLTLGMSQIGVCTKKMGYEPVCLQCEFTDELKTYIENNGGRCKLKIGKDAVNETTTN